jgi:uncharacterized protein
MKKRIDSIDVLRGFALLGILLMNMSSYAMPTIAYFNPTVYGGADSWNRLVFSLSHIFADQKMMALFSMLFGASVMLVTGGMEKKGQSPLKFYYSRNLWLLVFGLIHSILIWNGDILVVYALCSFVLYWLRHLRSKWQMGLGLLVFFLPALLNVWVSSTLPYLQPADWRYLESYWQPQATAVAAEIDLYQGSYAGQVIYRLNEDSAIIPYTNGKELLELSQLIEFFSRALGMMLVGMAFYSWGILSGERSSSFYIRMAFVGFGIGLPIALIGLYQYTAHNWNALYSLFLGRIPNHIATPLIACGYIALIMLWCRSAFWVGLRDRLAAVGRMALTNYIAQSLLATFIFYGFGLGLFGSVNRVQQLFVILLIWGIQLAYSSWWLSRFRYGPLEWAWRSLSYWHWQPLKKREFAAYGD